LSRCLWHLGPTWKAVAASRRCPRMNILRSSRPA